MRIVAALFLFVLTLSPARAIELTIGDEEAMKPVRTLVAAFIQPGFERFAEQAELAEIAVSSLCKEPGDRSLEAARNAFKDSALALARVEFLRTGPLAQARTQTTTLGDQFSSEMLEKLRGGDREDEDQGD